MQSVATANAPRYGTTPTVLFHDRDIAARFLVSAIAPLVAARITPTLLVGTLSLAPLAPPLAPLAFLLLRITNADLRATIGTDAELNGRLRHQRRADDKTRTDGSYSQKGKFSHGFNSLGDRDVTSDDQGGSNPQPHRGTLPHTQKGSHILAVNDLFQALTLCSAYGNGFETAVQETSILLLRAMLGLREAVALLR
jgi:hypothetical protein